MARRRLGYLCLLLALGLVAMGAASMYGFLSTPHQPVNVSSAGDVALR
jgi:hypothetical protein